MKKILVPTDFSLSAHHAAEYAAALAAGLEAEVSLFHVYKEHIPPTTESVPYVETMSERQTENLGWVTKEARELQEHYAVDVKGQAEAGFKSDAIIRQAGEGEADLIVVGIKKEKHNRFFGDTVTKLIRKATPPLLLIPEEAEYRPLKNMVLAVDFNEMTSSAGFHPLLSLVKKFDATLRVVHVEKSGADLKASEVPEKMQLGLALSKFTYLYEKVEADDVEQGILKFIEAHPADLLVMLAHHHNLLERVFGMMHTRAVGLLTKLPLLILKNE